jgi:hypothetical protein
MGAGVVLGTNDPQAPAPPVAEIFHRVLDPAAFRQLPTTETPNPRGHRTWQTDFEPA